MKSISIPLNSILSVQQVYARQGYQFYAMRTLLQDRMPPVQASSLRQCPFDLVPSSAQQVHANTGLSILCSLFNTPFLPPLRHHLSWYLFHFSITSARVSPAGTPADSLATVFPTATLRLEAPELAPSLKGTNPASTRSTTDSTVSCNTRLSITVLFNTDNISHFWLLLRGINGHQLPWGHHRIFMDITMNRRCGRTCRTGRTGQISRTHSGRKLFPQAWTPP